MNLAGYEAVAEQKRQGKLISISQTVVRSYMGCNLTNTGTSRKGCKPSLVLDNPRSNREDWVIKRGPSYVPSSTSQVKVTKAL